MSIIKILPFNHVHMKVFCEDDQGVNMELSEYFTFYVPGYRFMPGYKRGIWDGRVRLYHLYTGLIYQGLFPHIHRFAQERDYQLEISPEFSTFYKLNNHQLSEVEATEFCSRLNLCARGKEITLHDYQIDAFRHAVNERRTLLLSPTASGKSAILFCLARWYGLNAKNRILIIVPTTSLVEQMYQDFAEYSYLDSWNVEDKCHRIYEGKSKITDKAVVISTWQSIYRQPPTWFYQFSTIMGDECHGFTSESLKGIMEKTHRSPYKIGTTGTLDGTKTHKLVLEGLFGPVKKVITTAELMEQGKIATMKINCLVLKHPEEICKQMTKATYPQELDYIVDSKARNLFIRNLVLDLKGNTLVLFRLVEKHGKILFDIIQEKAGKKRKVFFIYGSTEIEQREAVRTITERETDAILVASYGVYSTGVDIRNIHNIVFASPSKSRIRVLQSIGRGLRKSETKNSMDLYDVVDDIGYKKKKNHTLKHFLHRLEIYAQEKFSFRLFRINLY